MEATDNPQPDARPKEEDEKAPVQPQAAGVENPYVGPSPFEEHQKHLFHGRDVEAIELFSRICAHPIVLFYSESGAGKTSLLNARVIPKLKEQDADVLGVVRVGLRLPEDVKEKKIANVFVFNALLNLQGETQAESLERLRKLTLPEYLKARTPKDQNDHRQSLRVLIFDQFEELFTSFTEHWEKRESFFLNISEALKADPFLRVVFAMRETYIAALDPYKVMLPQRLQNRFRLERLREDAALSAVEGPLKGTGRSFDTGVAKKLVTNLTQVPIKDVSGTVPMPGEFVDPVQLQIVCHSMWENLPDDVTVIDKRAVARFGDVDTALGNYYEESLAKVLEVLPDKSEKGLRSWFGKKLITPFGTRGIDYMREGRTEEGVSEPVVTILEKRRLIRPELRGGVKWYELTHDRFIQPIIRSNENWFQLNPDDKTYLGDLEKKANAWQAGGGRNAGLLTHEDLHQVRRIRERPSKLSKLVESGIVAEYIFASEEAARRRRRKWRFVVAAAIVAGVLWFAYTVFTFIRTQRAARAQYATQLESADRALKLADTKGKEYEALAFAIEAVGLSGPSAAPLSGVEALKKGLTIIDDKVWLREGVASGIPNRVEISKDGSLVLSVNQTELCVANAITGLRQFPCKRTPPNAEWNQVSFSPNGKLILVGLSKIQIMREGPQSKLIEGAGSSDAIPDDENILRLRDDTNVYLLDAYTGAQLKEVDTVLKGALGLQISDSGAVVLADFGNEIKIIDLNSKAVTSPATANQSAWQQIAISPDGSRLVTVFDGVRVDLLATGPQTVIGDLSPGITKAADAWDAIAFSENGERGVLVRSSADGRNTTGIVWNNATGQRVISFRSKVGKVEEATFSADLRTVAVFGVSGAEAFDAFDGTSKGAVSFEPSPSRLTEYAGTNVVTIDDRGNNSTLSVRNVTTETAPANTEITGYKITKAEITPDGRKVVMMSEGGTLIIWNVGPPTQIEGLSSEQLLSVACAKLQHAKEYGRVSTICGNYP